jgi:hypothetical protein
MMSDTNNSKRVPKDNAVRPAGVAPRGHAGDNDSNNPETVLFASFHSLSSLLLIFIACPHCNGAGQALYFTLKCRKKTTA